MAKKLKLLVSLGLKQEQRKDSVFGLMTYMGDKLGYWECKAQFPETGEPIELFVDGKRDDELEQQHAFLKQLYGEWPSLCTVLERRLQDAWKSHNRAIPESIWQTLRLSSISVPKASLEGAEWEISFATIYGEGKLFTVRLKGREPLDVVVDD